MAVTNPCGLSVKDVTEIIKDKVVGQNYKTHGALLTGLMADKTLNLNFSEAKQISDYYFSIYRKLANKTRKTGPVIHLSAAQKAQRQVNNLVVDYLAGNTGGFELSDADIEHIESLYEKADTADTPNLKAKFDEQANVFIAKMMPTYTNELFRSSVYARPLLSSIFFVKSFLSNFHAQVERSIANSIIWDGKAVDLRFLTKFDGLANASMGHSLRGGIPATTIAHNEQFDFSKGRLEEFDFKGTSLEHANYIGKKGYFGVMKHYTKWSNRFNAAPDTRGIYANAERHMYQLLREKYMDAGMTYNQATQEALKDMALDDLDNSTRLAEDKFAQLGLPTRKKNGKRTSEFKVTVQEYMRLGRDKAIWGRALELAKNDFWKKNMTVKSQMGFGDTGLFGLKARGFAVLKKHFESKTKSKVSSAFQLYAFGFLNGAANFAEDALERMPLYGLLIKVPLLQAKKNEVRTSDRDLFHDIARRQKDIIVKTFTTAMFFIVAKLAEHLLCGDQKDKQPSIEIAKGFSSLGPCGIPFLVPPQMQVMYKVYNILNQVSFNDEKFFENLLHILPVLVQSNEMGLGGAIDKAMDAGAEWTDAKGSNNDIKAQEALEKFKKQNFRILADFSNNFLPLPSRLLNEAGTFLNRLRGRTQTQQSLNFSIDEEGHPAGWLKTLGNQAISQMGNVTGLGEVWLAAAGTGKPYAMDWQGRKVVQFRGRDIFGDGIQYNEYDQLLLDAGVMPPYISRVTKVEYDEDVVKVKGVLRNRTTMETNYVRYLTDEEFYNVSTALSEFNRDYMDKKYDDFANLVEDNKPVAKHQLESFFDRTKKMAIEAVKKDIVDPDGIYKYIKRHWETRRKQTISESEY